MPEVQTAKTICYLEIPAPDVEKAGKFYKSAFGWTIMPSGLDEEYPYSMFTTVDGGLSGALDSTKPVADGGVILYIEVDDITEAQKAVEDAGGTNTKDKTEIGGDYGFYSLFKDPNGHTMGIWAKT